MDSGKLRQSVTIQQPTAGNPSASGEVTYTWSTFKTVRAEVVPQGAREAYRASQVHPEMTHLVKIRYLSGVTSAMRIAFGSRTLNIVSVIDVEERHHEMQLVCEEEL